MKMKVSSEFLSGLLNRIRKLYVKGDESNNEGVYVEWRGQYLGQGPELFAVTGLGYCLNKNGEWEFEPQPSSRDGDFIKRCRWEDAGEAFKAALKAEDL